MSAIEFLDRGVELLAFLPLHQQLRYLFTPLDVLDGLNTSPRAEGEVQLAAVIEDPFFIDMHEQADAIIGLLEVGGFGV